MKTMPLYGAVFALLAFQSQVAADNLPPKTDQKAATDDATPQVNEKPTDPAARGMLVREQVSASAGELTQLVADATVTLAAFRNGAGDKPKISDELMKESECVAVFPSVTKAAVLVGGRHGDGVVTCRSEKSDWSQIAFLDLVGASFGAQLGVERSDLVVLFRSKKARSALEKGRVVFGADATIAFGDSDKSADTSTGKPDMLAFSDAKGGFAGASLTGTYLKADADELQAYYREPISLTRTITTYIIPDEPVAMRNFVGGLPK